MNTNNNFEMSDEIIENIMNNMCELYTSNRCLKKINIKAETNEKIVEADISLLGDIHHCSFILNLNNEIIFSHCDCQWHKNYQICPHIKVSYEMAVKIAELPYTFEDSYVNDIENKVIHFDDSVILRKLERKSRESIRLIKEVNNKVQYIQELNSQDQNYEIEPIISSKSQDCFVSFKIGKKKKYFIKSLPEFLMNLEKHNETYYGQLLQIILDENCFTDFSKQMIQFIRKYYCTKMKDMENKKSIPLKGQLLDEFYNLLNAENEKNLSFLTAPSKHKFKIHVNEIDHLYIFSLVDNVYYFGEQHIYQIKQNQHEFIFYRISLDNKGITCKLIEQLKKDDLVVQKEDYAQFFQHVLSIALPFIEITLPE